MSGKKRTISLRKRTVSLRRSAVFGGVLLLSAWLLAPHAAPYTLPSGSFSDNFHIFAVEWEPNVIRWYVDGTLYQTGTPSDFARHDVSLRPPVLHHPQHGVMPV
jgi:hypothetical protein